MLTVKYEYRKTFTFEGKRYNAYGHTEKEALLRMFEKQKALSEGKTLQNGSITVSEWTEIALDTYKPNLSAKGKKDSLLRIKKHILPSIGYMPIKNVKPIDCQRIINDKSDMSFSFIQKLSQEMNFIFKTALRNHLITENPCDGLSKPNGHRGSRQSITEAERSAFLEACKGTDRFRLFELMLYCGCRPEEAAKSVGSDLSIKDGVALFHIRGTKTKNSDRIVPMPSLLYQKLKNIPADKPLAPNCSGSRHTKSSYERAVASLKRAMNIAMGCQTYRNALIGPYPLRESFVPYDLRHTYCTDLARRNIDLRVAQRLMGHSSVKITADIYTHIEDEQIISEASKILGN